MSEKPAGKPKGLETANAGGRVHPASAQTVRESAVRGGDPKR